ncbi:hypothetical protein BB559_003996 [Furculomyces boomerangus]|uniref:Uncharacterized protein n=1 Tax=Furculomyces boomerangus TaxID=61424 RepID=A0A2T9YHG0_9FUNG|nr:hypothetical protein BB559_003996 [Furculomyces boomerangus]
MDYVGLVVALDAMHAEKAWYAFIEDPENSVIDIVTDKTNISTWKQYTEQLDLQQNLKEMNKVASILIDRDLVLLKIVKLFAQQILIEKQTQQTELKFQSIVGNSIGGKHWGNRISIVLNHLFAGRIWALEHDITKNINSEPIFNGLQLEKNEYDVILQSIYEYSVQCGKHIPETNGVDEHFVPSTRNHSLSSILSSLDLVNYPSKTSYNVVQQMQMDKTLDIGNVNQFLQTCLVFGDMQTGIQGIKTLLGIDLHNTDLKGNIEIGELDPNPTTFVLAGNIVLEYESSENPKSNMIKILYNKFCPLLKNNDFGHLALKQTGINKSRTIEYLIPQLHILFLLFSSLIKENNVDEALNTYEAIKLVFGTLLNQKTDINNDLNETETEKEISVVGDICTISFENISSLVSQSQQDWWIMNILSDMENFGLVPTQKIFSNYFDLLAATNSIKEIQSFAKDFICKYKQNAKIDEICGNILIAISQIPQNNLDTTLESIALDIYNFVDDKQKGVMITTGIIKCLCKNNNLEHTKTALEILENRIENKNDIEIQQATIVMDSFTKLLMPELALGLFETFLKAHKTKLSDCIDLYTSAMKAYHSEKEYSQVIEIGNLLIPDSEQEQQSEDIYSKDGLEVSHVVDSIQIKDIPTIALELLFDSHVCLGNVSDALRLLETIRGEKRQITSFIYSCLIRGFGDSKSESGIQLVCALANLDRNIGPPTSGNENENKIPYLNTDYYNALIEAYANCGNPSLAFQAWEVMQIRKILPSTETAKVLIDICGWTERNDFSAERTLMPIDTQRLEKISKIDLVNYTPDPENPNTGKMINLYRLGYILDELKECGFELSKANTKSIFEVLVRGRKYTDAVEYLTGSKFFLKEVDDIRAGLILGDSVAVFAKNILQVAGEPAQKSLDMLSDMLKIKH